MAKEIETYVKLQVPAGQASPSPPVGPALGQHGLPLMDFCNAFNARTKELEPGLPCPVVITVYEDKSFDFIIKTIHPHYSVDYRPIFPWLIVFSIGMIASRMRSRTGKSVFFNVLTSLKAFTLLIIIGRNSLSIYLLHQPILFCILSIYVFL